MTDNIFAILALLFSPTPLLSNREASSAIALCCLRAVTAILMGIRGIPKDGHFFCMRAKQNSPDSVRLAHFCTKHAKGVWIKPCPLLK